MYVPLPKHIKHSIGKEDLVPCSWVGGCRISPRTLGWALVGGISPWHDAADWRQLPYAFLHWNLHEIIQGLDSTHWFPNIYLNNPLPTLVPNNHRRHSLHQESLHIKHDWYWLGPDGLGWYGLKVEMDLFYSECNFIAMLMSEGRQMYQGAQPRYTVLQVCCLVLSNQPIIFSKDEPWEHLVLHSSSFMLHLLYAALRSLEVFCFATWLVHFRCRRFIQQLHHQQYTWSKGVVKVKQPMEENKGKRMSKTSIPIKWDPRKKV